MPKECISSVGDTWQRHDDFVGNLQVPKVNWKMESYLLARIDQELHLYGNLTAIKVVQLKSSECLIHRWA